MRGELSVVFMALTRRQQRLVRRALGVARVEGASPRERKALVEALGVESNYTDVAGGDRDSSGALQQRPSQGWGPASEPLSTDVRQFLGRAEEINRGGFSGSAGDLAQAVQVSAYPDRYDERSGEAERLIRRFGGSGQGGGGGGRQRRRGRVRTVFEPTRERVTGRGRATSRVRVPVDTSSDSRGLQRLAEALEGPEPAPAFSHLSLPDFAARATVPAGYQAPRGEPAQVEQRPDYASVIRRLKARTAAAELMPDPVFRRSAARKNSAVVGGVRAKRVVVPGRPAGGGGSGAKGVTGRKGLADFEGTKVAAWIAPILRYGRAHGWEGGVNSGWRSDAEQTRIYQSGVRPAAVPRSMGGSGSNHEFRAFPGGAVDVSDAATLSKILKGSPYANLLVWAGSKDPVHFSHPHGGSY